MVYLLLATTTLCVEALWLVLAIIFSIMMGVECIILPCSFIILLASLLADLWMALVSFLLLGNCVIAVAKTFAMLLAIFFVSVRMIYYYFMKVFVGTASNNTPFVLSG
jgi:hypothetical protein